MVTAVTGRRRLRGRGGVVGARSARCGSARSSPAWRSLARTTTGRARRRTRTARGRRDSRADARPDAADAGHARASALHCTRASLAELAELMARAHDAAAGLRRVHQARRYARASWEQTDLWRTAARAFPDVTVVRDDDGRRGAALWRARRPDRRFSTRPTGGCCSAAARPARAVTSATTPAAPRSSRC